MAPASASDPAPAGQFLIYTNPDKDHRLELIP